MKDMGSDPSAVQFDTEALDTIFSHDGKGNFVHGVITPELQVQPQMTSGHPAWQHPEKILVFTVNCWHSTRQRRAEARLFLLSTD